MAQRTVHKVAYLIKSQPVAGGELRPFAVANCHACPTAVSVRLKGPAQRPDLIAQKFEAAGWAFDPFNASRITCPACLAVRAAARRGESGRTARPGPVPAPAGTTEGNVVTLHLKTEAGTALPPNKPELTVEERGRVRDLLLGSFDEKAGQYSEGWSDRRVADEVGGVPWKLVADLREIAFGPLRAVVELEPVTVRLNEIDARLEAVEREAALLKDEQGKLRALLGDTAKRLGVR